MSDIPTGRICKGCGQWKLFDEFHKDKYGQYGYYSRCKECKRQYDNQRKSKLPSTLDRRALQAQGLKRCSKCETVKKPKEFPKQPRGLFGRRSVCKECAAIVRKEWEKKNPDYGKQWYAKHRDRIRAEYRENNEKYREYQRQYYAKNRDEINAYQRQWRGDNPEKAASYGYKWREKNPDYYKEYAPRYHAEHREEQQAKRRQYYAEHKEEHVERHRKWRRENPEKVRAIQSRRRARDAGTEGDYTDEEFIALCEKYDNRCLCCGEKKPLTVDHVIPLSKGGSNSVDNLQCLCQPCNSKKHTKVIDYRL